jgi:hypothetical protein
MTMEKRKRTRVATPTDLAGMAKCEMELFLKSRHGNRMTAGMAASAREGTRAHEEFERRAGRPDRRCFVASWALGPDDPVTESLREWRDSALMPTARGRALVRAYYALSPMLVGLFSPIPGARRACAWAVSRIASMVALEKPNGRDE